MCVCPNHSDHVLRDTLIRLMPINVHDFSISHIWSFTCFFHIIQCSLIEEVEGSDEINNLIQYWCHCYANVDLTAKQLHRLVIVHHLILDHVSLIPYKYVDFVSKNRSQVGIKSFSQVLCHL